MNLSNRSALHGSRQRGKTILAASIAALLAGASPLAAQTLYWDPNLAVGGAQGGSGDWDAGNFWWNGNTNVAWASGADAVFGFSDGFEDSAVDVGGMVLDDLQINVPLGPVEYTLFSSGGALTFAGGDGVHVIESASGNGFSNIISASIAGTGDLLFQSTIIEFRGNNSYAGDTRLGSSSQLIVRNGNAIPNSSTVKLEGTNSVLNVIDSETIGGLSGSGTVNLGSATTLTVGANNSDTTHAGVISGAGSLVKVGSGTLTIGVSGITVHNTYTGLTTISAGKLALAGYYAIPQGVSIAAGATLQILSVDGADVTSLVGAGTLDLSGGNFGAHSGDFSGTIVGPRSLFKLGSETLTLSGDNTFTGGVIIDGGAISVASMAFLGPGEINFRSFGGNQKGLIYTGLGTFHDPRTIVGSGSPTITVADAQATLGFHGFTSLFTSVNKNGPGTMVVSSDPNALNSRVVINEGTLSVFTVANGGIGSPLGSSSNSITIGSSSNVGRLHFFTAGNGSTSRPIVFGPAGG